jgi:hypothetical protein
MKIQTRKALHLQMKREKRDPLNDRKCVSVKNVCALRRENEICNCEIVGGNKSAGIVFMRSKFHSDPEKNFID